MALQDNWFNPTTQRWEDRSNGNYMDAQGIWHDPRGFQFNTTMNTWIDPNQRVGGPGGANVPQPGGAGPINIPQGWGYELLQRQQGFQGQQNALNNQNALQQQQIQSQTSLQNTQTQVQGNKDLELLKQKHESEQNALQRDFEMKQKQIEIDAQKYINERELQIRQLLQTQQIDATAAQNERDRVQKEAEFAQTLAFNNLELKQKMDLANLTEAHNFEISQQGIELQKGNQGIEQQKVDISKGQADLEARKLEASLAANPANFVMNELFKRGKTPGGTLPQNAGWSVMAASNAAGGNPLAPAQATAATSGSVGGQPAYDDPTLAGIANDIFGTGMPGSNYNPQLGGAGIFGSTIRAPNQVSRSEALGMSDSEKAILGSFLGAGVDMGSGQRTAIDPAEWWQQQQNSLVPTLDRASSRTSYVV